MDLEEPVKQDELPSCQVQNTNATGQVIERKEQSDQNQNQFCCTRSQENNQRTSDTDYPIHTQFQFFQEIGKDQGDNQVKQSQNEHEINLKEPQESLTIEQSNSSLPKLQDDDDDDDFDDFEEAVSPSPIMFEEKYVKVISEEPLVFNSQDSLIQNVQVSPKPSSNDSIRDIASSVFKAVCASNTCSSLYNNLVDDYIKIDKTIIHRDGEEREKQLIFQNQKVIQKQLAHISQQEEESLWKVGNAFGQRKMGHTGLIDIQTRDIYLNQIILRNKGLWDHSESQQKTFKIIKLANIAPGPSKTQKVFNLAQSNLFHTKQELQTAFDIIEDTTFRQNSQKKQQKILINDSNQFSKQKLDFINYEKKTNFFLPQELFD